MKLKILPFSCLCLIAGSYIIKTLEPLTDWLRWSDLTKIPLPKVPFNDSVYYLSQIRDVLAGDLTFGNPMFYEYENASFSFGNSSLFIVWGLFGLVFGLNLIQTYLVMVGINSILLVIGFFLLSRQIAERNVAIISTLVSILVFVEGIGRPSPTQQFVALVALQLFCYLRLAQITKAKSGNSFFFIPFLVFAYLVLVSGNPLYSAFFLCFTILNDLYYFRRLTWMTYYGISVNLIYFLVMTLNTNSLEEMMGLRFGIHDTRFPGALRITISCFVFCLLAAIILIKFKNCLSGKLRKNLELIIILNVSLIIVVNSQLITGRAYEMEAHFFLLFKYLNAALAVPIFYHYVFCKFMANYANLQVLRGLFFVSLVILLVSLSASGVMKEKSLSENDLTRFMTAQAGSEEVILIEEDKDYQLSEAFILLTHFRLYWHPYIAGSTAENSEIVHRFACSRESAMDFQEFSAFEDELFFHQFSNTELKLSRAKVLFPWLRKELSEFKIIKKRFLMENYKTFVREFATCSQGNFKYKLDYIVKWNSPNYLTITSS